MFSYSMIIEVSKMANKCIRNVLMRVIDAIDSLYEIDIVSIFCDLINVLNLEKFTY